MKSMTIVRTVFILILSTQTCQISAAGFGTAFSKGATSIGFVAGSGRAFKEDYIILGVGVGYYIFDGLELGVDVQRWFSGDPSITKISPQIRYVFTQPGAIKPYVGLFYRRTFIEGLDDDNSFGYRAGAYFSGNSGVYIGGGIVYEEYEDCSRFIDCSSTYPEILVSISY